MRSFGSSLFFVGAVSERLVVGGSGFGAEERARPEMLGEYRVQFGGVEGERGEQ
jgi:hypothetical protein